MGTSMRQNGAPSTGLTSVGHPRIGRSPKDRCWQRLSALRPGYGQPHREGRSAALLARYRYAAPMLLYDLAHTRQPEPGATHPSSGIACPVEALEDIGQFGLRNPDALVADDQYRPGIPCSLLSCYLDRDLPSLGAVFHGVRQQVTQYPLQASRVPAADGLGQLGVHPYVMSPAGGLVQCADMLSQSYKIDGARMQFERLTGLEAGDVEEPIDLR